MTVEQILILFLPTILVLVAILLAAAIYVLIRLGIILKRAGIAAKVVNKDLPKIIKDTTKLIENAEKTMVHVEQEVEMMKPVVAEASRASESISKVNNLIENDVVPAVEKISSAIGTVGSIAEVIEGFAQTASKFGDKE